ncbi:GldM family protein [Aurantibacillus circumpalustris]|uniref:type IX secretion system motor protein PorM/GldM n=1 Tax=Aurantibacillus circumpalustris TaxID=3036359 RepID=UPI00295B78E7|nr:GldM family protein [Aurantibacillus circumpalustris]
MAGGKETPRQKMIGLMYLVLTAMLALNVSKSILNGYISVNESLEKSKKNIAENNQRITDAFKSSINGNAAAAPYFQEAQRSQKDIFGVFRYIDSVKVNMVRYVLGGDMKIPETVDSIKLRKDPYNGQIGNYDKPMTVMLGTGDHPSDGPLTAVELGRKLTQLHDKLIAQLDKMQKTDGLHLLDEDYSNLKKKIGFIKPTPMGFIEDKHEFTWEEDNVYHLPMAAVLVNLNKMQADLKNVEAEILQVFSGASGKLAIKFDNIYAKVIAPSSYISAGEPYKAEIFLAATNSKLGAGDMEVMVGVDSASAAKGGKGSSVPIEFGMGKYSVGTGAPGDQKYSGVIKYKKPDGSFEYYPFKGEYKVAKSAVAVSADQMNVFYRGVVNPVSAGAAGVSPSDIVINAVGAGVKFVPKAEAGKYDFTFSGTGECSITVSKKGPDGVKPVGPPQKFRVKPLPKPDAKIGGKFAPDEMKKGELSTVAAIGAGASGFDFQANYIVQSYEIIGKIKGSVKVASGNGSNLSADALAIFRGVDVGSKIYIDIKVKGPDGLPYSSTCGIKINR